MQARGADAQPNRGSQPLRRQGTARDRSRAGVERPYPLSPEWLVGEERHGDRGHPGAQPGGCGARAAVMDHRRAPREEPVVRHALQGEHLVGEVRGTQAKGSTKK